MIKRKTGLKRGLDALLSTKSRSYLQNNSFGKQGKENAQSIHQENGLLNVPLECIRPGKYQPRKEMTEEGLEELANSIRSQGIIQPVVLRPTGDDVYELIAGERRWRAAQRVGLETIPAIIKNVPDDAAIAMSLIENIQRENLNVVDEAVALQRLIQEFELTHQQVAEVVGKSRTTITNLVRLLGLNEDTKTLLEHGDIEMGHARALLSLTGDEQSQAGRQVAEKNLSVRETEALVKKLLNPITPQPKSEKTSDIAHLERNISEHYGSLVKIHHNQKGKGKLVIHYSSIDELDGILSKMGVIVE